MMKIQVVESESNIRLDRWFKRRYSNVSFIKIAKFIRKGEIKLNGKKVNINHKVEYKDWISFSKFVNKILLEENLNISEKNFINFEEKYPKLTSLLLNSVIFQNEDIIFINKPAKLATQGGSKVKISLDDLSYIFNEDKDKTKKLKIVHRLDKDTSGLIMFAKNTNAAAKLSEILRNRSIEKSYIAILKGVPKFKQGFINTLIYREEKPGVKKEKDALTEYFVIDQSHHHSLVMFKLYTGRHHQLRIHSATELNSPILGDAKYSKNQKEDYLYLHSYGIKLNFNKQNIELFANLPQHFVDKALELNLNLDKIPNKI